MPRDKDETRQPRVARCSFCDKTQDQVRRIIAGNGVYICDECVKLCMSIVDEDYVPKENNAGKSQPMPELLQERPRRRSRRTCPSPPKSRRCSTST